MKHHDSIPWSIKQQLEYPSQVCGYSNTLAIHTPLKNMHRISTISLETLLIVNSY